MKKQSYILGTICLMLLSITVSINAQIIEEKRPFDYSDEYYLSNGINAESINKRRNGFDEYSVFDFNPDRNFRDVRIIGTSPIRLEDGTIAFAVEHGSVSFRGFTNDRLGSEAESIALAYPIYIFPSEKFRGSKRQQDVIRSDGNYFDRNPIGLSVRVEVTLTEKGKSKDGKAIFEELLEQNGRDLDGGFAIHTVNEINRLTWMGLIKQEYRWDNRDVTYSILTVIEDPTDGAIASDAFIDLVRDQDGRTLESEKEFEKNFDCLKKSGNWCK